MNAYVQYAQHGGHLACVDLGQVAIAGVAGFAGGFLAGFAPFAPGATVAARAFGAASIGSLANGLQYVLTAEFATGEGVTGAGGLSSMLVGGIAGVIGGPIVESRYGYFPIVPNPAAAAYNAGEHAAANIGIAQFARALAAGIVSNIPWGSSGGEASCRCSGSGR